MTPRKIRIVILALASIAFILQCLAYWPFHIDDAYTTYVYSANLVAHNGLTYNGVLVEGYSNFLWSILIALLMYLGLTPLVAARTLSILAAIAIFVLVEQMAHYLLQKRSAWAASLPVLLLATSVPFVVWTVAGLETLWMTLCVTSVVYLESTKRFQLSALSAFALLFSSLTRPEGAMLFLFFLVYHLIWNDGFAPSRRLQLIKWGLWFVVPYGLYLAWRFLTYGYFIPNTAFLKVDPSLHTFAWAGEWLIAFLLLRPFMAALLGISIGALVRKRRSLERGWGISAGVVGAFLFYILIAGRDWMPHHRFIVPVIPLLSILTVGVATLDAWHRKSWLRHATLTLVATASLTEIIASATIYLEPTLELGWWTDGLIEAGQWIEQNTLPEDTIAVVDAGALAYYSQRHTIDINGLNDVHIAHSSNRSDPEYVLSYQPVIVQLHVEALEEGTDGVPIDSPATKDLYTHPDFRNYYVPVRAPAANWPTLFIREGKLDPP